MQIAVQIWLQINQIKNNDQQPLVEKHKKWIINAKGIILYLRAKSD
jgi:hypothetical protein